MVSIACHTYLVSMVCCVLPLSSLFSLSLTFCLLHHTL
ncbi:hypothetical protein KP509_01G104500 [Ceratopteris richardii]|uniref:Uncharacterized protein n=1 Tax=Ceratopteris richardii TaxID=49495 RepID=A0A8T2VSJ3_CERRI|nr:hypothetical protein KP509_01G104500 [Ceratopteris richardii]